MKRILPLSYLCARARHRDQLYDLFFEYGAWTKNTVYTKYGIDHERVIGGTHQEMGEKYFPVFTSLKPPVGIILVLEVDGKVAGMGRLSRLEDDIAEINNMFISPSGRGKGYGKEMLKQLEEKAREFGYSTLRARSVLTLGSRTNTSVKSECVLLGERIRVG